MGKHKSKTTSHRIIRRILPSYGTHGFTFSMCLPLLFIVCFSLSNAFSNTYFVHDKNTVLTVSKELEIYPDVPSSLVVEQLINGQLDDRFKSLGSLNAPLSTHAYHWAKINLSNQLPEADISDDFVMEFSLILTDIEIFTVDEEGNAIRSKAGFFTPFQERSFRPTHKRNLVRVSLPKGALMDVYIKAKSDRYWLPPKFDFKLSHADHFNNQLKNQKQANGIFVGFIIMILIYNLFLFVFNKDRASAYYSFYLTSILLFALYNTGDLFDWFDEGIFANDPRRTYFLKISVYLFHISYLTFLRVFLRLPSLLPVWDKIFKRFILWFVIPAACLEVTAMIFTQFNYNVVDTVTVGSTIAFLILSILFLFPLYRTGDRKGFFIIGGFIFMGLGIFLTIIARVQSIEFSAFFFKVGTILEIIIFSLGLAFRQRETEKHRQHVAFELEKSQILQNQKELEARQLEELDQLKTAFYTNITHEFRTPLTVIMGMVDAIKGHEKEKELIQRNSYNLLQLINQLLDLSKLDAGRAPVRLIQADIIPFLQYLTESFYSLAKEKRINLTLTSEPEQLVMDFDETKIQHIANNLLSNALKFTPEGGEINLIIAQEVNNDQPFLKIKVTDNGVGIPSVKLPHIFNRFYQAHARDKHTNEGTGIGLALTKEMTELLGGTIRAESREGHGSTFIVLLPVSNQADSPVKLTISPQPIHPSADQDDLTEEAPDAAEKPIVLVIEDSRDVATYIKSILSKKHAVLLATNGQDGIDQAVETTPDLIITDVMMPHKNGFEVTRHLKQDQRTSHIPIIMLTAKASDEDRMDGLRSGADAYLKKPFVKAELLVRIDNLMRLKKEIQQRYNQPHSLQPTPKLAPDEPVMPEPSIDDLFIQQLQAIVHARIEDANLSISDLCAATGLSHSQLYRKLKALTNKTPIHFIRAQRLLRAQELLADRKFNISEIAYQVGFNDPNYFSRMFVQEFGHSPSESRR
ncbi:MAG: ATP-binding protein [Bacteroidota bacterium]